MDAVVELIEAVTGMPVSEALGQGIVWIIVLSMFVEITPVKLNPVTMFFDWIKKLIREIGNALNGPVLDELAKQKKTMSDIRDTVDDNEIDRIRWEILDFANSCRNKRRHTREEFLHIINLNEKYHKILDERGMTNGQIDIEYEYIEGLYRKCLEENSFLCANGDDDC